LLFSTIGGVAVLQPALAQENPRAPRVVIEDATLEGQRRDTMDVARNGGTTQLEVPPGTRSLEIGYTGLSSPAPERLQFRYRLVGLGDDGWTYAGTRRTAYFSLLPPGTYRFQVAAANRDGVWSDQPTELTLRVRPTLWQSDWLRALLIIVGLAVAGFAAWQHLLRERQEHERQRAFAKVLLERQEAERKRIAAELHDSVGQDLLVIKNRALMGVQGIGSATENDPVRTQFTEISEIAGESIKEVRRIAYNLRPYQLDRIGLTAALEGAVRKAADGSEIRFDVRVEDVDALLSSDGEIHVFRIVQEGVSNVIRHSGAASASVVVRRDDGRLRLRIEDDGRGLRGVPTAKPMATASAGGFGLAGIAERVQVLGGEFGMHSPPEGGTVLEVTIPMTEAIRRPTPVAPE
jgi:signal transduction histidine kinase